MWTDRRQYERNNGRYASDLTDEEWKVIERFVPRARALGRPRETDMREVVNALLYIADDPERIGVQYCNMLRHIRPIHFSCHLKICRKRSKAGVKQPRHQMIFKVEKDGFTVIQRVLHERTLVRLHLTL